MTERECPRFMQIAAAYGESQDAEGNHASHESLFALDDRGRVWEWVNAGSRSGWHGPLDAMYVPPEPTKAKDA